MRIARNNNKLKSRIAPRDGMKPERKAGQMLKQVQGGFNLLPITTNKKAKAQNRGSNVVQPREPTFEEYFNPNLTD